MHQRDDGAGFVESGNAPIARRRTRVSPSAGRLAPPARANRTTSRNPATKAKHINDALVRTPLIHSLIK